MTIFQKGYCLGGRFASSQSEAWKFPLTIANTYTMVPLGLATHILQNTGLPNDIPPVWQPAIILIERKQDSLNVIGPKQLTMTVPKQNTSKSFIVFIEMQRNATRSKWMK